MIAKYPIYPFFLVAWAGIAFSAVPNDPDWAASEYLQGLGLEAVWEEYGFSLGTAGRPVPVIAIVDNGFPASEDFRAWVNPGEISGNELDDDGNGYIDDIHGFNFMRMTADLSFSGSHGSRIARIAGSLTHNEKGTASPASVAALMSVLYYEEVSGSHFTAVDGMLYAIRNGADILNCSFVSDHDQMYTTVLESLEQADVILVTGSGNQMRDLDKRPLYPAALDHPLIVTVGSMDRNGSIGNSNFGASSVDLFAPARASSYAVPLVASALAMMKALKPGADSRELIWALLDGVEAIPELTGKCVSGGRLHVGGAVESLMSGRYADEVSGNVPPVPEIKGFRREGDSLLLEWGEADPVDAYEVQVSYANQAFADAGLTESPEIPVSPVAFAMEPAVYRVRGIRDGLQSDWTVSQAFGRRDFVSVLYHNPVHLWEFNEEGGTVAADSGKGSLGLPLGDPSPHLAWPQMADGSLAFTGPHTGLEIPDSPTINHTAHPEFTVALRVMLDPASARQTAVLYEQGGFWRGLNVILNEGWLIAGAWNRPAFESNWEGTFLNGGMMPVGTWIQIALILSAAPNGVDPVLRLFVNGVEVDSGFGAPLWPCYEKTGLGQVRSGTVFKGREIRQFPPFQGSVDFLGIWDTPLEEDQLPPAVN